jgi:hypothetical protein
MEQDTSAAVYSEAKSEYTKQLVFNFQPVLLRFFLDRYNESKASPLVASRTKSALSEFQDSLSQIPEWNIDKVQRETGILLEAVHCDYIDDLITAVFIAHTKILSAIRLHAKPRRRIQITVPKPDHFMHRAMSECSRLLWSNIYLFSDSVSSLERQKYMTDVNRFLEEGILQAIRNLLPVKSILRDSLQDDEDDAIQITNLGLAKDKDDDETGDDKLTKKLEVEETDEVSDTPVISKGLEPSAPAMATDSLMAAGSVMATDSVMATGSVMAAGPLEPVVPIAPEPFVPAEPLMPAVATELAPVEPLDAMPKLDLNANTLVVDTERSVGFTGMDSVFGDSGHAELRPMIDEGDGDLKFLGESEDLDLSDIEDLDTVNSPAVALSADDYESL